MSDPITYTTRGPVAVIQMANPPVNGLGHALRSGIVAAIDRAVADPAITAIVLTGSDTAFSGGADVREFGTPKAAQAPTLLAVLPAVEDAAKPVVAAIAGNCLGGGLELAMSCHYRVALASATLGLPEVKLGLIPGASGTQRLPRLIGLEAALNMIVSGAPVHWLKKRPASPSPRCASASSRTPTPTPSWALRATAWLRPASISRRRPSVSKQWQPPPKSPGLRA
jgi:3-hydroxyacyl-CoA dehydrogenase